jgi:hypothetical protein
MKTSELTGAALDWAVSLIDEPEACKYGAQDWREQRTRTVKNGEYVYRYHQSWAQGGPIIERERFEFRQAKTGMLASYQGGQTWFGPTPLIAAMRCYVASKLGDNINIPEELL